jgi:hypothetical protein
MELLSSVHWLVWVVIGIVALFTMQLWVPLALIAAAAYGIWLIVAWAWNLVVEADYAAGINFLTTLGGVHMEAFAGALVGSALFWGVIVGFFLIALANDYEIASFIGLGVVASLVPLAVPTFSWVDVAYKMGYFLTAGFLFTFVKWAFYTRKAGRKFKEWLADQYPNPENYDRVHYDRKDPKMLIKVYWNAEEGEWETEHRKWELAGYCATWTVFWPFYLALIILEDFLKEAWMWVIEHFGGIYNRIAKAAYN